VKSIVLAYSFFFSSSVFDSVQIPYPKREFITDDESSDAAGAHVAKTEPANIVKTEASSVLHTQQQSAHVNHSQQQQNVHIKQQPQQQHNNLAQQTHAQQVCLIE
jgi:hypothetical protein